MFGVAQLIARPAATRRRRRVGRRRLRAVAAQVAGLAAVVALARLAIGARGARRALRAIPLNVVQRAARVASLGGGRSAPMWQVFGGRGRRGIAARGIVARRSLSGSTTAGCTSAGGRRLHGRRRALRAITFDVVRLEAQKAKATGFDGVGAVRAVGLQVRLAAHIAALGPDTPRRQHFALGRRHSTITQQVARRLAPVARGFGLTPCHSR